MKKGQQIVQNWPGKRKKKINKQVLVVKMGCGLSRWGRYGLTVWVV